MLPKPESAMEMSSRIRSKCGLSSASIFSLSDPKIILWKMVSHKVMGPKFFEQ